MSIYKNTITLKGFLGKDAEQRTNSNQTPFTVLSLATQSSYKDKQSGEYASRTEWHRIVAFGKLANSAKPLAKGAYIEVDGELYSRQYTDKSGNKRRVWEVRATSLNKLERAPRQTGEVLDPPTEDEVPI
jgi:single-strand DNA-binding protein